MTQEPNAQHLDIPQVSADATVDALQAVVRFLRVLRFRKNYLITALFVAGLLGIIYYSTVTRIYEATASVLIIQSGDAFNASMSAESSRELLIPTYEKLFTSPVVLDNALQKLAGLPAKLRIDVADLPRDKWAETIKISLTARRARQTNIVDLAYRSKSPDSAEAVLQVILEAYVEFMEKTHKDVSVEIASLLDVKLKENQIELDKAQEGLLEIKKQAGIVVEQNEKYVHPIVQGVIELNQARIEAQKQRLELEATAQSVQDAINQGRDLRQYLLQLEPTVGREMLVSGLGLNPQFAEVVGNIERQMMDSRAKLEAQSAFLGPTHPEIVELKMSISDGEKYLTDYQASVSNRISAISDEQLSPMLAAMVQEKLAKTKAHESHLDQAYRQSEREALQLNNRLVELQIAEDRVDRLRSFQLTLQDRLKTIDLKKARGEVQVKIVGESVASDKAVWPRLKIVGLFSLMGGLFIGCGIVYVLDLLDDRFRSPEEMRDQLGVPLLAMVRDLTVDAEVGPQSLHVHISPSSMESEAFRTLRTTLAFSGQDSNRLAITSSEPSDGKTTVIANLGVSYSQAGKRTLIIDADMRKPGLSKLFQMRGAGGMSEVLRSAEDFDAACLSRIQHSGVEGLDILPCGPKPSNPVELLSDKRFSDLIAWAETHYDQVLIDCPPVMAAADAAIIGRLADGMLLVVQPAKNHRHLVIRAVESLLHMQVNLFGIVANRVGEDKQSYGYGGYGYGYGYGYGHDDDDDDEQQALPFEPETAEEDRSRPEHADLDRTDARSSPKVRRRRAG